MNESGYHEIDNFWIYSDPYEMAAECKNNGIKVLGFCDLKDNYKVSMFAEQILDIGIVAEYEDGTRFWCHAKSDWFKKEEWD